MAWPIDPKKYVSYQDGADSPFNVGLPYGLCPPLKYMTKADVRSFLNCNMANLAALSETQWVWGELLSSGRTKAWRGIAPFCVQVVEVRPYPMVDLSLYYTKHIGAGANIYFADTLANATQAYADFASTVYSISGGSYQMVSVAVGNRCYVNSGGSSLSGPTDGYYLTGNFDRKVYHFVSSYLTEIISI